MKKRIVDLRDEQPLLDVAAYARAGRMPTAPQRLHIALTVHRAPEVMVKVSGGARTLSGAERHMAYVGRNGDLGLETDFGARFDGKGFQRSLVDDWNLEVDALQNYTTHSFRGRKPPKLVHNIIFSMPPGTSASAVLRAVKKLAVNEWALQHRYALALHTDDAHPHVHVVLKAVSEQGVRLNVRKVTLRSWRAQFAANLRELGVDANATERAVRGQTKTRKLDGIYHADRRGQSTHVSQRKCQLLRALSSNRFESEPMRKDLESTRRNVRAGWHGLSEILEENGDHNLAEKIRLFGARLPSVRTEKESMLEELLARTSTRTGTQPTQAR